MNLLEILNAVAQKLGSDPGSPTDGQFWVNTATNLFKIRMGGVTYAFGRLDQLNAPTGALNLNSQKITGLADGTAATDAATKGQVDAAKMGLDVKDSVRAATTVNGALATAYENGDTIDGVVLATGDRILIKNQTTGSENGIYTVNASGAPTRATDADTSSEVNPGLFVWVEEGTANADTAWVLTTNAPITLGTTALAFAKFASVAAVTTLTKFSQTIGDGSATTFNVDHNIGSADVHVQVYKVSDGTQVEPDITRSTTNRVVIAFAVAPASNEYRVVVIG
jgi:hypothetical protein